MQPRYLCYLAGPITGISFKGSVDWREEFIKLLPPEIEGLSPMRGKHYLEGEEKIAISYESSVLSCSRGIMTRDYNDCSRADVIVVNLLGATFPSIGTIMEMAWGWQKRTPIIAVMEKTGNPHEHSMLGETIGYRLETLEAAADLVKLLLLPAPHRKSNDLFQRIESIKTEYPTGAFERS